MGRRSRVAENTVSAADRFAISLIGSGALLGVAFSVIALVASAVGLATAAAVRVTGVPVGSGLYPPVLAGSDAPVDAGFESAWIEVANLPDHVRMLLWVEQALPTLAGLVIAVAIAWLALALLRGAPFTRAFPWVLVAVASAVMVAGLGSQFIGAVARAETVAFLGPPETMTGQGGFAAFGFELDLGPIGWGLGLGLVAAAFQIGTRLQRETRGLV